MKHFKQKTYIFLTLMAAGCSSDRILNPQDADGDAPRIHIAGEITQVNTTRVNDSGFCDGDAIGVYIVDYEGNTPGKLLTKGNRGDNTMHTFEESNHRWNSAYDLYWKDQHTRIDIYAYYPFGSPDNVNEYAFTVQQDQSKTGGNGKPGGYEASDFLWGKVEGVEPTSNPIRLPMRHIMANARITLTEGTGFEEGEWDMTKKQVLVTNTRRNTTIDISTGKIHMTEEKSEGSIIPATHGDEWRAIILPQTMPGGTVLFNITIDGMPYTFSKNVDFTYTAGKMSNFTIRVDKRKDSGTHTLTLIGESITAWENDLISHDATSREYVVVSSTPGALKDSITSAGKDFRTLRNLKVTGRIDSRDFYFMRDEMDKLQALNIKEVRIKGNGWEDVYRMLNKDDQIPGCAFFSNSADAGKTSLTSVVLPDTLKSIGSSAFRGCFNLSGSLIIPEGVEDIQLRAFEGCRSLTGILSLPSSLKYIGNLQNEDGSVSLETELSHDYHDTTFGDCGFTCELTIPENVELILGAAFTSCKGLHGNLKLPHKLKRLGWNAFGGCHNIKGSLEIPAGIKEIEDYTFTGCGFDGTLTMHDGISVIGQYAFSGCHFKGELRLPKDLIVINDNVFDGCDFSGELKLPQKLITIGDRAFAGNWRLTGNLEFSEGMVTIGSESFSECLDIEGLTLPGSLENIREGAFRGCHGIRSIISKSEIPPYVEDGAFDGIAKDNFTLEVPEPALTQYQAAAVWREFKRIAAHHELVCRPSVACALHTERKQTLVINSEGEWDIASKPDWCEVSPSNGNKKTDVTLTIKGADKSLGLREGDVVFRLKGKEYTHRCHVTQCGYEYGEDEYLALQKATKGRRGGINIFIIGDGYNAREIAGGRYLRDIKEATEHFFAIEPYTTYRDYFNVYTAFPVSTESGVGSVNTIRHNRFETSYAGGVGLKCDYPAVFDYALGSPTITADNLNESLIIIVPNTTDYGGICQMWESGAAIAFCPKSDYGYPLDSRGVIQHEAGGHGFGKLGDEYVYHNAFIDNCGCSCCGHVSEFQAAKSLGWYDNLELTGKMHEVGWSHLIFDSRYSDIVDIFEGGYMHTRGVFRSEQNSCMNNDIPYYSTISRESIVKRIKRYAGEEFDFEDFVAHDNRAIRAVTRGLSGSDYGFRIHRRHQPVFHKGNPLKL